MDLDDIPTTKKDKFPPGVSEVCYESANEMDAFLHGLDYVNNIDVDHGKVFIRDGAFVVRVGVGDYGDYEEEG